ncbi:DsbA family protein [Actinokineospora inagensis]|uniref:DsbA family protein n=1 Tax=Actinokineospora inagensis TaxID=103730 RepID=UPI000404E48F|nr:thioredoxin domain-containing protein [Actinokineospora inagensis]
MGGAERSARKRRQNQAVTRTAPVAAARKAGSNRNPVIVGVLVVVIIAAAVIAGVIYSNSKKNSTESAAIAVQQVSLSVPATRDGAVVTVGKDTAKATIDVYEDFLCPICGEFEKTYGPQIEQHLADGTLRVRYHMVNLLNDRSDPAGYSTDSANAALLAADAGKFYQFHKSLFADQPEEGARGWSKDQLTALGNSLGITTPAFAAGIQSGTYNQQITDAYNQARSNPSLQVDIGNGQTGFGTPTIAANNKTIDTSAPTWLTTLLAN